MTAKQLQVQVRESSDSAISREKQLAHLEFPYIFTIAKALIETGGDAGAELGPDLLAARRSLTRLINKLLQQRNLPYIKEELQKGTSAEIYNFYVLDTVDLIHAAIANLEEGELAARKLLGLVEDDDTEREYQSDELA